MLDLALSLELQDVGVGDLVRDDGDALRPRPGFVGGERRRRRGGLLGLGLGVGGGLGERGGDDDGGGGEVEEVRVALGVVVIVGGWLVVVGEGEGGGSWFVRFGDGEEGWKGKEVGGG